MHTTSVSNYANFDTFSFSLYVDTVMIIRVITIGFVLAATILAFFFRIYATAGSSQKIEREKIARFPST